MASLPIDFNFDYEKPTASRRGEMRTPASIYLSNKDTASGGILFISQKWLDKMELNGTEIAMQVKDNQSTFILFNPPKNAPRFKKRDKSPRKNSVAYSCTETVRKMFEIFGYEDSSKTTIELWLEPVGTFGTASVCRLRNLQQSDSLYRF